MPYHVVLLGPPGAGKSTMAVYLADRLAAPLLRSQEHALYKARGREGFVLDGEPSDLQAAIALDEVLRGQSSLPDVVLLEVTDRAAARRIGGRLQCPFGHVYHRRHDPPEKRGRCDHDGARLERQEEDRRREAQRRISAYRNSIEPVLAFYQLRRVIHRVGGEGSVEQVRDAVALALGLPPVVSPAPDPATEMPAMPDVRATEALASAFGYSVHRDDR